MKYSVSILLLTVVCLTGCNSIQRKEKFMSAAGFKTLIPSTPAQVAQLKSLPQGKLIPVSKKGKTVFLFADSSNNLMMIGNQSQYSTYKQYCIQYNIQQDKLAAAELNADASYEWGAWGGFMGPGFY